MSTPSFWRLFFEVPVSAVPFFEAALEKTCEAVSSFETRPLGPWRIEGLLSDRAQLPAIDSALAIAALAAGLASGPASTLEAVEEKDWIAETRKSFPPLTAGRFFIYGSHDPAPPLHGRIGLLMDAGNAFGSGRHGSTLGCLLGLSKLARGIPRRRVLDIGCGSGILAIACAKLWKARVRACDIDPQALAVARVNIARNGQKGRIRTGVSRGLDAAFIAREAPYDLIIANILARPVAAMAPFMRAYLAPGGVCVFSGFVGEHIPWITTAARQGGLTRIGEIRVGEWATLLFRRLHPCQKGP